MDQLNRLYGCGTVSPTDWHRETPADAAPTPPTLAHNQYLRNFLATALGSLQPQQEDRLKVVTCEWGTHFERWPNAIRR